MDNVFECVGKSKVVFEGKEYDAELNFKGKMIDQGNTISFELILNDEGNLYDITFRP